MAAWRSFKRIPGPLQLLLMLLLPWGLAVTGQNLEITQRPEKISVNAGENLILTCILTGNNIPGAVRWYKGKDRSQTPIYSDKQAFSRVLRVIPGSNTDFSINIQNVRPEDAGTYYCVKFRAGFPERELVSGKGTVVSMIAKPSQPVIRGPTERITAGSWASFNCSTGGFSPPEITVSWLKDGEEIPAAPTNILDSDEKQITSYRAENTVEIPLEQGDAKSQLTCQIQHRSLDRPLQQTFPLGDVLRVPPKVRLETDPSSPVQLNISVLVTCNAERFFPNDAKVELFAQDAPGRKGMVDVTIKNPGGTFTLKSHLEVMATEDRNLSMFFCQVQHDSQPLVNESTTLLIRMQPDDNRRFRDDSESSPPQPPLLVLWIPLFLTKAAILFFIFCLFLMKVPVCENAKHHSRTSQENATI